MHPQRTAFVLAGGGSLGAVEVGMLSALVDRGVEPDLIVGSSVGAINGAFFAGHPDRDGVTELARIWSRLRRGDVFPFSPLRGLLGLLSLGDHLVDPKALRRLLGSHLGFREFEQAAVPLFVVATDVIDGTEVVLSSGSVVDAVMASAAIPGVFPPVRMNGRYLVDGGVANNTPISVALRQGAGRVIVLPTGFSCALDRPPKSTIGMALQALGLLIARQLVVDLEHSAGRARLLVVPPVCPVERSPVDFGGAGELIRLARSSTLRWLDAGGLERPEIPHQLGAHRH